MNEVHNHNLYARFHARFCQQPERTFLQHSRGELSYGDVHYHTGKLLALLQRLGIGKGERILVQVEKSPEAVLLYLACLRAGVVFVPLNTAYTVAELEGFIKDAAPSLLVCRPRDVASIAPLCQQNEVPNHLSLDAEGGGSLQVLAKDIEPIDTIEPCEADDLACILYTSGTTGRSKGAMLSHNNLYSNAQVLHQYWQWQAGDVLLHALPIFHVHGLFVALHGALLNVSTVIFLPRFDLEAIKTSLPHATVMMGVPTFYVRMLEDAQWRDRDFCRQCCRHMRLFIAGSAPLSQDTFIAFEAASGHRILERYGMTETGMISSNPYGQAEARVPGTVGFALPGVTVRVSDRDGAKLPAGKVGVLEVAGPNVFQGYWQLPDKTAEEFRADGFFITGDLASMDEDGRITIVGRAKDLIISGGLNVYPKEIELAIDAIVGVKESAVIGLAHPDFGEGVVAVVVLEEGVEHSAAFILNSLSSQLAKFKQPKQLLLLDELPRNAMGKVQKKELRQRYSQLFS